MKKKYICPNVLVVKLNTTHSILTVSGFDNGTMTIDNTTENSVNTVWTRENNSVWDEEW
ncbi:MAG: hypothetical protein IJ826_01345 [Bacteroidaceae bacterium]|nr:hypothetical protein [Bacteroidaceae bacterium]